MKRAFGNSHGKYNNSVDEEAKARLKHQNLLHEFLELQKEFVAKKKKLETVNRMRGTLSNEVGFLRQRYNYLSMIKSREYELQQDYGINEPVARRSNSLPGLDQNVVHDEEGGGRSQVDIQVVSRKEKKPQNYLINGKRVGKKKISWQDQVALEAL